MQTIDGIRIQIGHLEMQIKLLEAELAHKKFALAKAIRKNNEPLLGALPEEVAAILRRAADYGLFIEKAS